MGLGGINVTQLLIVLAIVLVVFGTRRVKSLGSDLGGAIKGFRRALNADDDSERHAADNDEPRRHIASDSKPQHDPTLAGRTGRTKPGS